VNAHKHNRLPLALAIATLIAATTVARTDAALAATVIQTGVGPGQGPRSHQVISDLSAPARYFVTFREAPLALYDGSDPKFAAAPRATGSSGRRKLDSHSSQAQQYVAHLAAMQTQHMNAISGVLGRTVTPLRTMRAALDAVVVELTHDEAARVAAVDGVAAVRRVETHALATDVGPQFIGATNLWSVPDGISDDLFVSNFDGNYPAAKGNPGMGDGVVVGDIDTGYNSLSPSFQATDDQGYTIQNPLGAGNYLGQCGVPDISLAGCNNKVIGLFDMVDDGVTAAYSVEDTQGHGSHTASTAAGNSRSATLQGNTFHISGVAPHANLVIFYGCTPNGCPDDALAAAADQAVQDGVVDVINFSISGGFNPWEEPTSVAFLGAEAAGIFVAAAAGNTQSTAPPAAGSANHLEPWVTSVAAGTHIKGPIGPNLSVTGPGTPPAHLQSVAVIEGQGDTAQTSTISDAMIELSPNFDISTTTGTDGCSAYAAGTFSGKFALVARGTCAFTTKATNAVAAGATGVIVVDHTTEALFTGSTAGAAVPVYLMTRADGINLQTFLQANNNIATLTIPYPPTRQNAQPDVLAGFSLLGPAYLDVIKPEVQAPGVSILAAFYNDGSANGRNNVALDDGTSMATPHTTGAGALLSGIHPDWSPMEIKSALMMTAREAGLTEPDTVTPSNFFERGAGRIQVDAASKAALVLDESAVTMGNADPALGGNGVDTLNLASMQNSHCSGVSSNGCAFTRTFRSTSDHAVTWTASFSGDAVLRVGITPASFAVAAADMQSLNFAVDATAVAADKQFHQGEVVLTPDDASLPTLHLPMAIAVQPPAIAVSPNSLSISIPATASSGDATFNVNNTGGPTLQVTNTNFVDGVPQYVYVSLDQSDLSNSGAYSTYFTSAPVGGQYLADDFTLTDPTTDLAIIRAQGFIAGGNETLANLVGRAVHFRIYGTASGHPDGAPEVPQSPPDNAPVWQFDTNIGHAGLNVDSNSTIRLDLAAANAPPTNLPPGTYWLVVYPEMNYNTEGGWAMFLTNSGSGYSPYRISPSSSTLKNWTAITDYDGVAIHLEQRVACGASWLSTDPGTLTLGGLQSGNVTVTADSGLFDGGVTTSVGYICVQSNDAAKPVSLVKVVATQQ
jgi:hypothetical protein